MKTNYIVLVLDYKIAFGLFSIYQFKKPNGNEVENNKNSPDFSFFVFSRFSWKRVDWAVYHFELFLAKKWGRQRDRNAVIEVKESKNETFSYFEVGKITFAFENMSRKCSKVFEIK